METSKAKEIIVKQSIVPLFECGQFFVHESISKSKNYTLSHDCGYAIAHFDSLIEAKEMCISVAKWSGIENITYEPVINPPESLVKLVQILDI